MKTQIIQRTQKTKNHPFNSVLPPHWCNSTVGGIGEISLPLSLGIVGTDISLDDNAGAVLEVGRRVGKQRTQAVASLEMRMRVVASFEVSNSRGLSGPICAARSRASRQRCDWLNLVASTPERYSARFAQLATSCSNPTCLLTQKEKIAKNRRKKPTGRTAGVSYSPNQKRDKCLYDYLKSMSKNDRRSRDPFQLSDTTI